MATVNGTNASETINSSDGVTNFADLIFGFGGDDVIFGLGSNDIITGGAGADRIDGGSGIDTASYSDSAEAVTVRLDLGRGSGGTAAADTLINIENLIGSAQDDSLRGNAGDNRLDGGDGADALTGGGGDDILNGGAGGDRAFYVESASAVFVSLINDFASGGDASGDDLNSIEHISGSNHGDQLWGDDGVNGLAGLGGNDVLKGFGGADTLVGGDGDDQLFGMDGDDTLNGADGADDMFGGIGNDLYLVDDVADAVTEAVGEGTLDRVLASATYTLTAGSEIEVLETLSPLGTAALDLVGNEFDNTINGNNGQNTIVGGLGLDVMTGNGGGDVFVWTSTADTALAGDQADVVTDFNRAAGDLIAVNPIDANETVGGDQAFTFVGIVDFAGSNFTGAGQIGFFTTATDTFILLNTRVDAGPVDFEEATIRIAGVHAVDASWFVL